MKEPRQLSEAELLVIREWYAKKDKQLEDARGQSYVAQRNLSAQAKLYHEASSANHKETQALLRAQAASQNSKLDRLLALNEAPVPPGRFGWVAPKQQAAPQVILRSHGRGSLSLCHDDAADGLHDRRAGSPRPLPAGSPEDDLCDVRR